MTNEELEQLRRCTSTAELCARTMMDVADGDEDQIQGMLLGIVQHLADDVFGVTAEEVLADLTQLHLEDEAGH